MTDDPCMNDDASDEEVRAAVERLKSQFERRPVFSFDAAEVIRLRRMCEWLWAACAVLLGGLLWVTR